MYTMRHRYWPVSAHGHSQTLASAPTPPVSSMLPSGENARARTPLSCASNVQKSDTVSVCASVPPCAGNGRICNVGVVDGVPADAPSTLLSPPSPTRLPPAPAPAPAVPVSFDAGAAVVTAHTCTVPSWPWLGYDVIIIVVIIGGAHVAIRQHVVGQLTLQQWSGGSGRAAVVGSSARTHAPAEAK